MGDARDAENALVEAFAQLEAVEEVFEGHEVSDFMESFPIVRKALDIRAELKRLLRLEALIVVVEESLDRGDGTWPDELVEMVAEARARAQEAGHG